MSCWPSWDSPLHVVGGGAIRETWAEARAMGKMVEWRQSLSLAARPAEDEQLLFFLLFFARSASLECLVSGDSLGIVDATWGPRAGQELNFLPILGAAGPENLGDVDDSDQAGCASFHAPVVFA